MSKPIIFNGEMVKAILDGRKTQTRRVIKPQPPRDTMSVIANEDGNKALCLSHWIGGEFVGDIDPWRKCLYGQPDDELWVRETTWINGGYVATDKQNFKDEGKVPSIYMRKWVSRITLKITDVRVERVRDISDGDCDAEGCSLNPFAPGINRMYFSEIWNSINEKRGFGWDKNPWVWVVEFEAVNNRLKIPKKT